jgi:hypothetical protein
MRQIVDQPPLRRNPVIGSTNDEFEREAEVMADTATRMADPAPNHSAPAGIQRRREECEDEEEQSVQTKPVPAVDGDPALDVEAAVHAAGREGASLPGDVRSYFESRFGYDFSAVRVHAGSNAADGARAIQARAYTLGHDIVFGSGEYAPATVEGKRLLAHELTHVVQQGGGRASIPGIQRQPTPPKKTTPAKFKPRDMTLEDVVKEMTGLGGPYADLKAWTDTIKPGKFLGHPIDAGSSPIKGVRPEFQQLLDAAGRKVDDEFKKSGNTIPTGYGIRSIGGFRHEISPHGAGVAIDIDGGDNPYIMHEGEPLAAKTDPSKATELSKELRPVYHRIAEFILNDPIDGEQSVIPKLITNDQNLPQSSRATRRERLGQFYDRLAKESEAMRTYFTLMKDDVALKAYLDGDWKKTHPGQSPPALDDVKKQMWDDFALLGGQIPQGGPPGISGFKMPRATGRPFHPSGGAQKDPASGFLTIPREVVLGLGQVLSRWGAIDFGIQSGDVMHFDDRFGVGKPFDDAKAPAKEKVDAENAAAKEAFDKAAADKAAADKAAAEKAAAEKAEKEKGSGSGSAAPSPQRKAVVGSPNDPFEGQADEMADRVMRMDEPPPVSIEPPHKLVPSANITAAIASERAPVLSERGGAPLSAQARSYFEPRVGYDFSTVRVHAGSDAAESAQAIQARAYTMGRDIVFDSGEYAPATTEGSRLLAHELAHVVQQQGGAPSGVVRRSIRPTDVSKELIGQKFSLRKAFSQGAVNVPAGEVVTVVSWVDIDNTAQVTSPSVTGTYSVPKYLLEPVQTKVAGISPYGVGLGKVESAVEKGASELEAFKKTEPEYKTEKGKRFYAKEVSEREAEQTRMETQLNVRLIQAAMLNRFDSSIKTWVDFYNNQFGFTGKDALDPNLIKAMVYEESQMGTFGDFMSDPTTHLIMTRFNILQAIDSWPEEQLLVIPDMMPSLIAKYHLENIQQDLLTVETELDNLKGKADAGTAKAADITRLNELKALSEDNWQPWFFAYKAPGETQGFVEAATEFLNTVAGGKKHKEDYDFWIRVGVRAVFEKHKLVSSWAEAARAYNGSGPRARKYQDRVVQRAEQAVKAEKAGKEFVPDRL